MLRVMRNHRRAAYNVDQGEYEGLSIAPMGIDSKKCPKDLLEAARTVWDHALAMGEEHGYRNAQTTLLHPPEPLDWLWRQIPLGLNHNSVWFSTRHSQVVDRIINKGVPPL